MLFIREPSDAQSKVPVAGIGRNPLSQSNLNVLPDWLPNVDVPALFGMEGVLQLFAKRKEGKEMNRRCYYDIGHLHNRVTNGLRWEVNKNDGLFEIISEKLELLEYAKEMLF